MPDDPLPARPVMKPAAGLLDAISKGLLALQVLGILRAFFVKDRFFAWAPYDEVVEFRLLAWVGGRRLDAAEIWQRYHLPESGRENRCARHLFGQIERAERLFPMAPARIEVVYSVNGRSPQQWRAGPK